MTLHFDHPWLLLLALLAAPLVLYGWRATRGMDLLRRVSAMALRTALLLGMVAMLAAPHTVREHDQLTVIGVLDVSGSVRRFAELPERGDVSTLDYLRTWFREATQTKAPDDRFGLVVFDGEAIVVSAPTRTEYFDDNLEAGYAEGTNIERALELALAMFPADTARRLVLVTDGNQTTGDALIAARQAAGGASLDIQSLDAGDLRVPIDVLPIAYQVRGDVQVQRVEVPPHAQPGQTVTVRVVLESSEPAAGRLTLLREDIAVDINGTAPGVSRRVELPAGQSVHLAQVALGRTPINRFRAVFEADDPSLDTLADNNAAEAFTVTPSEGATLVINPQGTPSESAIGDVLREADLNVEVRTSEAFPTDLLTLQGYDLVVMDNIAASELMPDQHELLVRYVSDLGGGLIMLGGENAFGAGGWNGNVVEDILPLELDPSRELRLPKAALVLVMDKSGSMNFRVAGARATQQEVANEAAALAIESLREDSLVGVVTFDFVARTLVPLRRNDDPEQITRVVRSIQADGGTDLEPALNLAYSMLADVEVDRRRIVCLSDGQSSSQNLEPIAQRIAAAGMQLTTIAIGDEADTDTLRRLAEIGNGEFFPVRNPRLLPRVLVDSVQALNKPLIKEGRFTPQVLPTGSTLTLGMRNAPPLTGLVITAAKPDPTASIELQHPDGEPLLAHWQAGLGRVAAFTSDFSGRWSRPWLDWEGAPPFWTQLARTISRPTMSRDAELITSFENNQLNVVLELTDDEREQSPYVQVDGTAYRPDGSSVPLRLRQTAPGRYETSLRAEQSGNYIVALSPKRGQRRLAPVIGGASRATSPEFRRYRSNLALLEQIVEETGGRRLDVRQPRAVDLFDRSGMPRSASLLPAWRLLLWLVLAIFLLDVACRRIAWSGTMIRNAILATIARVRHARTRAERASVTLSSLRRTSREFDARMESDASGVEKFQTTGVVAPPPPRPEEPESETPPPSRAGPDRQRVRSVLDAMRFRGGKKKDETETEPVADDAPSAGDDPDAEDEMSSESRRSLLEAKRRVRERYHNRE